MSSIKRRNKGRYLVTDEMVEARLLLGGDEATPISDHPLVGVWRNIKRYHDVGTMTLPTFITTYGDTYESGKEFNWEFKKWTNHRVRPGSGITVVIRYGKYVYYNVDLRRIIPNGKSKMFKNYDAAREYRNTIIDAFDIPWIKSPKHEPRYMLEKHKHVS